MANYVTLAGGAFVTYREYLLATSTATAAFSGVAVATTGALASLSAGLNLSCDELKGEIYEVA